jgi:hypothetical protein
MGFFRFNSFMAPRIGDGFKLGRYLYHESGVLVRNGLGNNFLSRAQSTTPDAGLKAGELGFILCA